VKNIPIRDGENRDANGRFLKGWAGGPGRPAGCQQIAWREAVAAAVTIRDIEEIVIVLMGQAKKGEPWAVKEFLDRVIGKAVQPILQADPFDATQVTGELQKMWESFGAIVDVDD